MSGLCNQENDQPGQRDPDALVRNFLSLQSDSTDRILQGLDRALVDVNLVGVGFNRGGELLAAQFQGSLYRFDACPGIRCKVAKQASRNLHETHRLDDQKGQRPRP